MEETRYKNTRELVTMDTQNGEKQKTAVAVAYEPGERAPKIIATGKGYGGAYHRKSERGRNSFLSG